MKCILMGGMSRNFSISVQVITSPLPHWYVNQRYIQGSGTTMKKTTMGKRIDFRKWTLHNGEEKVSTGELDDER